MQINKFQIHFKKSFFLTSILCICLLGYLFIGLFHFAYGQSVGTQNLTIIPPTVDLTVNPGGTTQGTMKLINDSSETINLHADTQDFIVTDPLGVPSLLPPNTYSPKYSAAAWIGVNPDIFSIAPHERVVLTYYVQVPPDARPGGHYTAVIFKPQPAAGVNATGASVTTQIGTLFSVHINGAVLQKASVTSFLANSFQEYGPVNLTTAIKNFGDSDITPNGTISFYDIFGRKIAAAYLPAHRIFPQAVRDFQNTFGSHLMIGRYTARLLASYGTGNNLPLSAEISFVVFPWRIAIIVVLLLIAGILGILVWRKRKQTPEPASQPESQDQTPITPAA